MAECLRRAPIALYLAVLLVTVAMPLDSSARSRSLLAELLESSVSSDDKRYTIEEAIKIVAEVVNEGLPQIVDNGVILYSVAVVPPNRLTYHYKPTYVLQAQTSELAFRARFEANLRPAVCALQEMRALPDWGIEVEYHYIDAQGIPIDSLAIPPDGC